MTDGTRDTPAAEGRARYAIGALVVEDRRGSRVGRVEHAWDAEPPVLYRFAGADDPRPWIAWEHHLRPATKAEIAGYEDVAGARRLPPAPRV